MDEIVARAIIRLSKSHPFFASLVLKRDIEITDTIPTACTNGKRHKYNPAFMQSLTDGQRQTVVAHETLHDALGHCVPGRFPSSWHPELANMAQDHVINLFLSDAGMEPIPGWLCDPKYKGWSEERVYDDLSRNPPPPRKGKGGNGNGNGDGDGNVKSGDGSDGQGMAPEPTPGNTPAKAAQDLAEAQAAGRQRGKLPGSLSDYIDKLLKPKVDWKRALREYLGAITPTDYSYRRPNRQYPQSEIILPSLGEETLGRIAIAVDTSGSVSTELLAQFQAEMVSILHVGAESLTVIYCDAKVQGILENPQELDLGKFPGRGGTAFEPVFQYLADNPPDVLIYLTDGEGDNPPPPDYPVLWVSTGEVSAKFGTVIYVQQ